MASFGKLTRRQEFTAARKGRRAHALAFTAQIARRQPGSKIDGPRVGLTVTKKIGDAVVRNRIKRRLRAALRQVDAGLADPAADHVLIAKPEALTIPFQRLTIDIAAAVAPKPRRASSDIPPTDIPPAGV